MRETILVVFLGLVCLLLIDCGTEPVTAVSGMCEQCSATSIYCTSTLDDCIVAGRGTCRAGNYSLASDGVTAIWTSSAGGTGNWTMIDRDVVLFDAINGTETSVRLYMGRDGEVCP